MEKKLIQQILLNHWTAFVHNLLWMVVVLLLACQKRFNLDGNQPVTSLHYFE
jgi:hypothetical protein